MAEQRDINKEKMRGVCNLAGVKIGTRRNRGREKVIGEGRRNKVLFERFRTMWRYLAEPRDINRERCAACANWPA